jgi:hypothetical protein
MESEGVFIHLLGDDVTSSRWHLSIAERLFAFFWIDVGYSNPQLPWADTPADRSDVCNGAGPRPRFCTVMSSRMPLPTPSSHVGSLARQRLTALSSCAADTPGCVINV